jgi:hypothetical protein
VLWAGGQPSAIEASDVTASLRKELHHMGMTGEHEHLSTTFVGETHQGLGGIPGTLIIKVDQGVVHDQWQPNASAFEVCNKGKPKRQEDLLSGAATEPLRRPADAVDILDHQHRIVGDGGDLAVATTCKPLEPDGGFQQHWWLMLFEEPSAGFGKEFERRLQGNSSATVESELFLNLGTFRLQWLEVAVISRGFDQSCDAGEAFAKICERSLEAIALSVDGIRPLLQRMFDRFGKPAIDRLKAFAWQLTAGLVHGLLGEIRAVHRCSVGLTAVDLLQECLFALNIPAAEELIDPALDRLHATRRQPMATTGSHEGPPDPLPPTNQHAIGGEPFAKHRQLLHRREPITVEIKGGNRLFNRERDRGQIFSHATSIFDGPPTVLVERFKMATMTGKLTECPGRDGARKPS